MRKAIAWLVCLVVLVCWGAGAQVPFSTLPQITTYTNSDSLPIYVWNGSIYTVKRISSLNYLLPLVRTNDSRAVALTNAGNRFSGSFTGAHSGALFATNLTSGRVVLAGSGGSLTDHSGLTYDSGTGNLSVQGNVGAESVSGSGALLTDLNASELATGTVPNSVLDAELAALGNLANGGGVLSNNGSGTLSWVIPASGGSTEYVAGGQSTTIRTNGSTFAVDVTGTLTNHTTGNAATATFATSASNSTNFYGTIHGSNNITAGTISSNKLDATAYAAFLGGGGGSTEYVGAGQGTAVRTNGSTFSVDVIGALTNNAATATLATNAINATNFYGVITESQVTGLVSDLAANVITNDTRAVGLQGTLTVTNVAATTNSPFNVATTNSANTLRVDHSGSVSVAGGVPSSSSYKMAVSGGLNADTILSGGSVHSSSSYPIGHNGRNRWWSSADGTMHWTKAAPSSLAGINATNTLMSNTNGSLYIPTNIVSEFGAFYGNAFGLTNIAESQVTGLVADLAAKVAVSAGNSIQTSTNGGVVTLELSGRTNVWNVLRYGAASYPANSTTAFNAAATNLTFAGGKLWFPRATYGITGTVAIQGGLSSGMPLAAYDYGNFTVAADKHARIYADVGLTNAFLFRTAAGQWRKSEVMDLSLNGTNTTHAIVPTLVGMAFDGPSGGLEVSRINIQQMGVAFVADDMTGVTFRNLIGANCGIGFAFGYKPDGVVVKDSTFRTNQWGMMTMFTNSQFTAVSAQEGNPSAKQVVFGQNQSGAILHSHGTLELDGCYFESNGPDTNSQVAVQIGFNTADPWQQSYTNNSPTSSKPRLFWKNTGMNFKHYIDIYHPKGGEVYIESSKMEGSAIPVVRLMTAGADSSLVVSRMLAPIWVTNSSGTWFNVPQGYQFLSNTIVPISGMSLTNLSDSTNIALLNGTNVFTGDNTFAAIVQVTNMITPWTPLTSVSNMYYILDFLANDRQSITATGDVNFASIVNISNGAIKIIELTNVFKASSNITVRFPTNTSVVTTNSGGPVSIDGTNYAFTVTNEATLSIQSRGTTQRRMAWYLRLHQHTQ